ncbi:MAG: DUF3078 domain-containing protein [Saprospiraceae bacterium]|nr:DUF3078 domain-containing protein [Saprospiraceae bacterium]
MRTTLLLFAAVLFSLQAFAQAPEANEDRLKEITKALAADSLGWNYHVGIGLDLGGTGIINPRVGGGVGRLGLGGIITLKADYLSERDFWNNQFALLLGVQKLQRTSLSQPEGFQKSNDVLRINSTYGHKMKRSEKWFFGADLMVQSQFLETYLSNYLTPIDSTDFVVSKFASPILVQLSPGITYKPNDKLSFQYSPVAVRWIYVADDNLARLDVHGNDVEFDDMGNITSFSNSFLGLGSEFVGRYDDKYYKDKIAFSSQLRLFANYLDHPENIDVLFTNKLSLLIWKGLSLDLVGEVFYDQDVKMVIDENDNNVFGDLGDRVTPATQLTGAFLLKYSKAF